ncbi:type II secretion system protein GspL [Vibrio sp. TH_r3]|uniref:type II secretion system protein GspL n=1 Tax=Vibrio sp. TH_r3 TaxID=3082084 RepID=UPI002954D4DA|nr:type II secretion system protein GspL [Vibrio sp. TH_r3]MDV7104154.1 type II secretion system protein GspL [Vibrio sp. TH_r3]
MSEFLTVRLSRNQQTAIQWLVWSTSQNEIIASGELSSREQLPELATYAYQRTAILLLDSRDVLLLDAELPKGAGRRIEAMLPYLLEDDLAQDVEALHFSILAKNTQNIHVAAIDKTYLMDWLDAFASVGVVFKKAIPDTQALPLLDDGIATLKIGSQWLFRKSLYQSATIEEQWLDFFVESDWCGSEAHPCNIVSYTPTPSSQVHNSHWRSAEPELVMALLAKGALSSSVNLLTGSLKPQSSILKNITVWRKAVIAACLFLTVLTVQRGVEINRYETQAKNYHAESERIFREIFPDKQRIPTVSYLKRVMSDEENRLSGGTRGRSIVDWLALLPDALHDQPSVQISNIRYDANRGEVRLDVSMQDFQMFELVRTKLAENFQVTQGPLDKKDDKVFGSFLLRNKS